MLHDKLWLRLLGDKRSCTIQVRIGATVNAVNKGKGASDYEGYWRSVQGLLLLVGTHENLIDVSTAANTEYSLQCRGV